VIHTSPPSGADATQKVHICEASLVVCARASKAATTAVEPKAFILNCIFSGSASRGSGDRRLT
jgi:hypothetical protein